MIGLVRAAALCATLALGLVTAQAADKAFKRDELADSAVKLEAQIKSEAGAVRKTAPQRAHRADAPLLAPDLRGGLPELRAAGRAPARCDRHRGEGPPDLLPAPPAPAR